MIACLSPPHIRVYRTPGMNRLSERLFNRATNKHDDGKRRQADGKAGHSKRWNEKLTPPPGKQKPEHSMNM